MAKLLRFTEGVMTELEWVERYADRVEQYTETWESYYNRRKFNSLENDGQAEYMASLKAKAAKPHYRAYRKGTEIFYNISRATYLATKKD